MRLIVILCLFPPGLMTGCARPDSSSQAPPVSVATPAQEADRVFAIAQDLEKRGDAKKAFAAYHQIIRYFPDTSSGRKATARIKKAQREAARKPRTTRK